MKRLQTTILLSILLTGCVGGLCFAQGTKEDLQRALAWEHRFRDKVPNLNLEFQWLDQNGSTFTYTEQRQGDSPLFFRVNPITGERAPLDAKPAPSSINSGNENRLTRYTPITVPPRPETSFLARHELFIKNFNVWFRNKADNAEQPLTFDGTETVPYLNQFLTSPDGQKLVVVLQTPAQKHLVHMVDSSPANQLQPQLFTHDYLKPGDQLERKQFVLFDFSRTENALEPIRIDNALFKNQWSVNLITWNVDSSEFYFSFNQRGHQVCRFLAANAQTGQVRVIYEQTSKTFIDYSQKSFFSINGPTSEILLMSEQSGWNHLYLIDIITGKVKNAITSGDWVVRNVEYIDWLERTVYFTVLGYHTNQDPYFKHLAKANLDGSGFKILTEGNGTHSINWSPDGKYFIDSWSTVTDAPVHELRDRDGKRILELARADASALKESGWKGPEPFVSKGRDGKTDIYGVIWRPSNYDPKKKYPVIENIYAGPQDFFTPKRFQIYYDQQRWAELGFIVVKCDGMGTNWRSRAFHDVCWKNLRDSGFPDRKRWIAAAAEKEPAMDLTRVGIYGGSAGGQNAVAALIWHNDFYSAAAADCGCHDNRMDKVWWNEQWMGWPVDQSYRDNSNVVNAGLLKGKLLLCVGELDTNVDPASTMQVVAALIRSDIFFELLVMPGRNHGCASSSYGTLKQWDFFVRSLWGKELERF